MCIIVAKNKGVKLPSRDTLRECFKNNKDGAGLMYVKNGKVIIDKGFMTFEDLNRKIKSLKREFKSDLTNKAIVFHFRIGTHGQNDKATTHPFPISNKFEDLRATHFETDIAMAHNGIISAYNYDKILSDTQSFIKDYVSIFKELNSNFYKNNRVMNLIKDKANISYNKLCFLDNKENIYWYGDKIIDNGVIYSNSTYKVTKYTPSYSRTKYNDVWEYVWSDWYDDKYYDTNVKEYTIDDFIKNKVKYEVLETGDYYYTREKVSAFVKKEDLIIIDNKDNLYSVLNDKVSLIGTQTRVYTKDWKSKNITYKGGLA